MTLQITNTTLSDGSIRLSCIHNGKLYTKAYSLPLLQARAVFRSFIHIDTKTLHRFMDSERPHRIFTAP